MLLDVDDPGYPTRLAVLHEQQRAPLEVSAPLGSPDRVVAIVGSRKPDQGAEAFARELAHGLARQGVIIVSGGAIGIDSAAHIGALDAGGATWVVSPSGRDHPFPSDNRALFARVEASPPSAMIWPFGASTPFDGHLAKARNRLLVALADAVVVIHARRQSGSLNAAGWARRLGRPLWIAPAAPWMTSYFGGLALLRDGGARPLWDERELFASLGLATPNRRGRALPEPRKATRQMALRAVPENLRTEGWGEDESKVIPSLCSDPRHLDQIASSTGLPIPAVRSALLTLTMKNVVVEGPDGFFSLQERT